MIAVLDQSVSPASQRMGKVGEIIEREMRARGWNQGELARRADVSQGTINKFINGTNVGEPKSSTLDKIAEALDIPSEDLHNAAKSDRLSEAERAELDAIPRERVEEYLAALDKAFDDLNTRDKESLFNKLLRVFNPWDK